MLPYVLAHLKQRLLWTLLDWTTKRSTRARERHTRS